MDREFPQNTSINDMSSGDIGYMLTTYTVSHLERFFPLTITGRRYLMPGSDIPEYPEIPLETYTVRPNMYYKFRFINAASSAAFRISFDEVNIRPFITYVNLSVRVLQCLHVKHIIFVKPLLKILLMTFTRI